MKIFLAIVFLCASLPAFAWEGVNNYSSEYVEIKTDKKANQKTIKKGSQIEFFDAGIGQWHHGEVRYIFKNKNITTIEVYDYRTGKYHSFDMNN